MPKIRHSASVLLARDWDAADVFLVLRGIERRAFPGTYVFPGGKVDPEDAAIPVRGREPEVAPETYAAAARELFEEVGVLVAAPRGEGGLDLAALPEHRRALLAGTRSFAAILEALDAELDGSHLVPLGEKTTPPFHPWRFRNRFFLAVLPEGQEPHVIPGELESGQWFDAAEAARRFDAGELLLSPPILLLCEAWGARGARQALPDLRAFSDQGLAGKPLRIRFSPEVILFPGKTPTLPPATHTNTYLLGADRLLVIDPATDDAEDQRKLLALIDELAAEGRRVEAVVLTHHHVDHVGAVEVVRTHTGAPLWGHAETAARMPGVAFDRLLEDGEVLDLGAGGAVRVLHTPGHAAGHLCFFQEKHRALIAGDMVSTASTILIDPDEDGDLAEYLAQLRRLRELSARVIHPSHGDAYPRADRLLDRFLKHRKQREDKLVAALGDEPRTPGALVPVVYEDTPEAAWPLAEISLRAGLAKLAAEGRAAAGPDGWVLAEA